jgi:hypothetical protein
MKLKDARVTFLVGDGGATIEFYDAEACITFAKATLTADQLCQALSRLMHTPCKMELHNLDKVGKTMEYQELIFEIPEPLFYKGERNETAKKLAIKNCPEGWKPELYFGSQQSFFNRDGKHMARCNIRRWV